MDELYDAGLRVGACSVGPSDVALLRGVAERGSLNAACEALGRSYSRAHGRLKRLEAETGPLLRRERGGPTGGGSELTDRGRELLARYARLEAALSGTTRREETVLRGTVVGDADELVTVETEVGRVEALLFGDGTAVQVVVPADAVTLHTADAAPATAETSARNRFEGTVTGVDRREGIARVAVDIGGTEPLIALVTLPSVDRVGIATATRVVASFKATAARATERPGGV